MRAVLPVTAFRLEPHQAAPAPKMMLFLPIPVDPRQWLFADILLSL